MRDSETDNRCSAQMGTAVLELYRGGTLLDAAVSSSLWRENGLRLRKRERGGVMDVRAPARYVGRAMCRTWSTRDSETETRLLLS